MGHLTIGNIYNRDVGLGDEKSRERTHRAEGDSGVDNGLIRDLVAKTTGLSREKIAHNVIWYINRMRNANQKGDAEMVDVYKNDLRGSLIRNDAPYADKDVFLVMFQKLVDTLIALTPESDPKGSRIDNDTAERFLYSFLPEKTIPEDYLVTNLHAFRVAKNGGNEEEIQKAKVALWQGLKNHGKEMSQEEFERFLEGVLALKMEQKS